MECLELPLLPCLVLGGLLAYILYAISAKLKNVRHDVHIVVHAITLGFLLAGAVHLSYGALCPNELVEVFDKDEKRLHHPNITVKIEMLHRLDIWIGSGFLIFTTGRALRKIYQNPAAH